MVCIPWAAEDYVNGRNCIRVVYILYNMCPYNIWLTWRMLWSVWWRTVLYFAFNDIIYFAFTVDTCLYHAVSALEGRRFSSCLRSGYLRSQIQCGQWIRISPTIVPLLTRQTFEINSDVVCLCGTWCIFGLLCHTWG